MNDIVERLRLLVRDGSWDELRDCSVVAADEIERLRDALGQAVDDFADGHCVCEDTKQMCIAALTAAKRGET